MHYDSIPLVWKSKTLNLPEKMLLNLILEATLKAKPFDLSDEDLSELGLTPNEIQDTLDSLVLNQLIIVNYTRGKRLVTFNLPTLLQIQESESDTFKII